MSLTETVEAEIRKLDQELKRRGIGGLARIAVKHELQTGLIPALLTAFTAEVEEKVIGPDIVIDESFSDQDILLAKGLNALKAVKRTALAQLKESH